VAEESRCCRIWSHDVECRVRTHRDPEKEQ